MIRLRWISSKSNWTAAAALAAATSGASTVPRTQPLARSRTARQRGRRPRAPLGGRGGRPLVRGSVDGLPRPPFLRAPVAPGPWPFGRAAAGSRLVKHDHRFLLEAAFVASKHEPGRQCATPL